MVKDTATHDATADHAEINLLHRAAHSGENPVAKQSKTITSQTRAESYPHYHLVNGPGSISRGAHAPSQRPRRWHFLYVRSKRHQPLFEHIAP